jgi:hypothetical protein
LGKLRYQFKQNTVLPSAVKYLGQKESTSDTFSENIVDAKAAQLAIYQHPLNEKVLKSECFL